MRIALVVNELDYGGTETAIDRLARGAHMRGHQLLVVAVRGLGAIGEGLTRAGIPCHTLAVPGGMRGHPAAAARAALRLGRLLQRHPVDVVHGFLFEGNAVARVAARRARLPAIASFRTRAFRLPAERLLEQTSGHWVARYTAVSDVTADQASSLLGIPRERIETIHNGVHVDRPPAPPHVVSTLGYLGRLHHDKGVDVLLEALAHLGDAAPELQIAGDGPEQQRLQDQVTRLALERRVRFLGRIHDSSAFIDRIDGLVVPSRIEGLSNVALEAMARARPVIVADAGGNRELVVDGVTGYVVPLENFVALAEAISRLCHGGTAQQLGAAGLKRVRHFFSVDRMVDRFSALWTRVADDPLPYARLDW